jgi:hypothetical protein
MMATLASINLKIGSSWTTLSSLTYPVGAYYLSNSPISPASLFGGTWTRVTDNRFLCGASSVTTGGENTHVLTKDEMPSHKHEFGFNDTNTSYREITSIIVNGISTVTAQTNWSSGGTGLSAAEIQSAGSSAAHNNMPLYRSCYMWYRTA